MKNLFFYVLIISIVSFGCQDEDDTVQPVNSNNNQNNSNLFRELYNNTYWISENGSGILNINSESLFTMYNNSDNSCIDFIEGEFNVTYDGCIYNGITLNLINETSNSISLSEYVPNGTLDPNGNGGPGSCENDNTTVINISLNSDNNISYSFTDIDNQYYEIIFTPMNLNTPNNQNCTQHDYQSGGFFGG